ncbi:MAG: type II secretion system major pseudopilin GspG [Deltaproteobacteria bacterium]|nr:type II secretion system major pseudopilin GspG [Deltaproteobacteria bacterium]
MFKRFMQRMKDQKGMTLIEIMVVVAIIGSIMALVTVNVMDYLAESKVETTKIEIKNIENALEQYKRKSSMYPSTEQGLQALVEKPTSGKIPENYPKDGYMKRVPKDAWDEDFIYTSPGTAGHPYEITSLGEDKAEGGEGYAADIKNYEIK